jgi:hypothetical protein
MRRPLHLNPHLTLLAVACLGLAGGTAVFLLSIPRRLNAGDPNWLAVGVSWGAAFFAQVGVFLGLACPVAVHAVSGRWSWSVRLHAAISAYWCMMMGTVVLNSYLDADRGAGHVRTPAELIEAAMTLAATFLLYSLFTLFTVVWVAMRGRRCRYGGDASDPLPDPDAPNEW